MNKKKITNIEKNISAATNILEQLNNSLMIIS